MALLLLFAFGIWHGLQPDHAAAAAGMAARHQVPAWVAALRVAAGHALALVAVFLLVSRFPELPLARLEWGATVVGALALVVLGLFLLYRAARQQPIARRGHSHATSAFLLGTLLGLSGARSAALILPRVAGPGAALSGALIYCVGITAGILVISAGADLARRVVGAHGIRLLDAALGLVTVGTGCWLGLGIR